jgi:hypothetical protein
LPNEVNAGTVARVSRSFGILACSCLLGVAVVRAPISERAHRELLDRNWELHEVAGPGAGIPAR